jgi:tetratricopeptide (TPR) repeat protein
MFTRKEKIWGAVLVLSIVTIFVLDAAEMKRHTFERVYENPLAWRAHYNLGKSLMKEKRFAEAAEQFKLIGYSSNVGQYGKASLWSIGTMYEMIGETETAYDYYIEALKERPLAKNIREDCVVVDCKPKMPAGPHGAKWFRAGVEYGIRAYMDACARNEGDVSLDDLVARARKIREVR